MAKIDTSSAFNDADEIEVSADDDLTSTTSR